MISRSYIILNLKDKLKRSFLSTPPYISHFTVPPLSPFPTLGKNLQHRRLDYTNHWDPSKLTHFNVYFDEDS